jgi:DNA-binding transcriptional MerR regulator
MTDYLTLGDVSRLLMVPPHRILYLISTRKVPEPMRVGGRRIWTMEQVAEISEKLTIEDGLSKKTGGGSDE